MDCKTFIRNKQNFVFIIVIFLFKNQNIQENTCLMKLNLMCNDIGPDGAEQIAQALQVKLISSKC